MSMPAGEKNSGRSLSLKKSGRNAVEQNTFLRQGEGTCLTKNILISK